MLAAFMLVLLQGLPGSAPGALDPRIVRSPSETARLEIDPADPYGRGAASYHLSTRKSSGEPTWTDAWNGTLPYTLRSAAVDDDGTWIGFAETSHLKGWPLLAVIVSPTGDVLIEQVWKQRSWGPDGPGYPQGSDVFLRPALGQCVFMLEENPNRAELWRVHDLATGRLVGELRPRELFGAPYGVDPLYAIAVPGTPLTLIQWYLHDHPRLGARFTLHDSEWVEVWRLDLPDDLVVQDDMERRELLRRVWRETSVAGRRERGFTLRSYAQDALLDFELASDPSGHWSVRETGRRDVPRTPPVELGPALELRALEPVQLRAELDAPAGGAIDCIGRLLVTDLTTGTVHVFDATGVELARCLPWPGEDASERRTIERFSSQVAGAPDGSIYRRSYGKSCSTCWQRFGRDGMLLEELDLETRWIGFDARTPRRWQLRGGVLERLGGSGAVEIAVSRHPDGTWLRSPSVRIAPVGAPVVLDEGAPGPLALAPWPPAVPPRLSFLAPDGSHERTVALPVPSAEQPEPRVLACSRAWALISFDGGLLLARRSTGELHPVRLAGHDPSPDDSITYGISPDGTQLWVVVGLQLERYLMP